MNEHLFEDQPESELEYHDGLGDMLCEKSVSRFSLSKTIFVFLFLFLIILSFFIFSLIILQKILAERHQARAINSICRTEIIHRINQLENVQNMQYLSESQAQSQVSSVDSAVTNDADHSVETSQNATLHQEKVASGNTAAQSVHSVAAPVIVKSVAVKKVSPKNGTVKRPVVAAIKMPPIRSQQPSHFPYKVVVGTFSTSAKAQQVVQQLTNLRIDSYVTIVDEADGSKNYRLQIGAFRTRGEAETFVRYMMQSKRVKSVVVY